MTKRPEKMAMMLNSGTGYNVANGGLNKATITTFDTPTTTSSRHRRHR